ncbi:unnamed protein product, partial [marine sediment metagenome]
MLVEQRIDDLVAELAAWIGIISRDEIFKRFQAQRTHHGLQFGFDPPAAIGGKALAGALFEQG